MNIIFPLPFSRVGELSLFYHKWKFVDEFLDEFVSIDEFLKLLGYIQKLSKCLFMPSFFENLSQKQLLKLEMIYLKLSDIIGESHKWTLLNTC